MMKQWFLSYYKRQQFYPNAFSLLINPFFFFRFHLMQVMRKYANHLEGRLLDFGCGSKPYQALFGHVSEYIGVDVENEGHSHVNEHIDVYYDGKTLPFEDQLFDSILSNEVLEHVPDLEGILSELYRVLKPGGKMLLTVPFVCFEHELPYDFRRFTLTGLSAVLDKNGFDVLVAEKTGNYVEVIFQLWISYIRELLFTKNAMINLLINLLFIFPVTLLGLLVSKILPARKGLYFDSLIIVQKRM